MRQLESFFWGIIAAIGALFIELVIFSVASAVLPQAAVSFNFLSFLPISIIAFAFIEEVFKYVIISQRVETYSFQLSFVFNSLCVGLGFAASELLLLKSTGNLPPFSIAAELATIHMGTAGLIGYMVAFRNPRKFSSLLQITVLATVFHASYNLLITQRELLQNYLIVSLLGILVFSNLWNTLRIKGKLAQSDF